MLISFRLVGVLVDLGVRRQSAGAMRCGCSSDIEPGNRNMQIYHYFHLCIATLAEGNDFVRQANPLS
jgi:hypothetical protein